MSVGRDVLLGVPVLGDSGDKDEQGKAAENSVEQRSADHVPHLVVELMQLVQPLHVALRGRGVGDEPNSQVVHVGHLFPGHFVLGRACG